MIRKSGYRFSEKIMLKQKGRNACGNRLNLQQSPRFASVTSGAIAVFWQRSANEPANKKR
jgi:hypothetical protein